MSTTALINASRYNRSALGLATQGFVPQAKPALSKTQALAVNQALAVKQFDPAAGFKEPTMSLFQKITQPKVLIGTGVALTIIGLIGLAYAFPVATAAHATTCGHAARSTLVHTHAFLQPGLTANAILLDMALKTAGVATSLAMPVISPAVSTGIVFVLGGLTLIYIANKVWAVSKVAICSAASFAMNKVDKAVFQAGPGRILKDWIFMPIYSAFASSAKAPAPQTAEQSNKEQATIDMVAMNPENAEEPTDVKPGMSPTAKLAAVAVLGLTGLAVGLFYKSGMSLSDVFETTESVYLLNQS